VNINVLLHDDRLVTIDLPQIVDKLGDGRVATVNRGDTEDGEATRSAQ
jgi:serine/threonine-protein kinase RIO1